MHTQTMSLLNIIKNYKWTTTILSLAVLINGCRYVYISKENETKRNRVYTNEELLKIAAEKTHATTIETAYFIREKILKDKLGFTTAGDVNLKGDAVDTSSLPSNWTTIIEYSTTHVNNVMLHKELRRMFPEMEIEIKRAGSHSWGPEVHYSWGPEVHCCIPNKEKEKVKVKEKEEEESMQ